uniref:Uncharacterized protein n=1 Tax=Meloidogyne enterolobii TaxID=390850 RepID=A0A6V7UT83_MELEN|nr:unnamed protein product [Meloidogyne enterolobii]
MTLTICRTQSVRTLSLYYLDSHTRFLSFGFYRNLFPFSENSKFLSLNLFKSILLNKQITFVFCFIFPFCFLFFYFSSAFVHV